MTESEARGILMEVAILLVRELKTPDFGELSDYLSLLQTFKEIAGNSRKWDPEEWQEINNRIKETTAQLIERLKGAVADRNKQEMKECLTMLQQVRDITEIYPIYGIFAEGAARPKEFR
jgi:hypothetical protein